MKEDTVRYEFNGRPFAGMLVYDDKAGGKRPALFMQPDWLGVCRRTIDQAAEIAAMGYVVLLADMFGEGYGERDKERPELMKVSRQVRADVPHLVGCGAEADRAMTERANELGLIASGKRAAIGFCIGGGFIVEQARAGADYDAFVIFHVTLPAPAVAGTEPRFQGDYLIFHGSDDPVTPMNMVHDLEQELTEAKVAWETVMYGHASHSFCLPGADNDLERYDEALCQRSYRIMQDHLREVL